MTSKEQKPAPFHQRAFEILRLEAAAVERSASQIELEAISAAIELISCCNGKIIVTGVGKSGIIAQKIAQTLTSTGTIAVFVHPSDAVHGGLGVASHGDVIIALSNSGETDEIIAMLPALARRELQVIAIVGNTDSTLARKAAVVLDASVDKEACPLNLAPTASTTVALAIGDALAMTVMEAKGLTAEDFAANHPAGRLGKRLTLTVGDLMHDSPNVAPSVSWLDVVHALTRHALGAVNVIDEERRLVGIITDGDLRRTIEKAKPNQFGELTAADMMTASPITTRRETLAFYALRLM